MGYSFRYWIHLPKSKASVTRIDVASNLIILLFLSIKKVYYFLALKSALKNPKTNFNKISLIII
jgi:hypothetical protein